MSGFLAGLVQRGASVAVPFAESPGVSANWQGDSAYALEAPLELVDAAPAPTAMPREDSAQREGMSQTSVDAAPATEPQSIVQIMQVNAAPQSIPRDQARIAAQPAEDQQSLRSVPPVTPPPLRQVASPAESTPKTSAAVTTRPIATPPPDLDSSASRQSRLEREVVQVSTAPSAPLNVAPSTAPASELPEVPLSAAPTVTREMPQISVPAPWPPAAPPIHVRIGKVEVRPAAPVPAPAAHPNASTTPALGFAAYRRLRTYRM